MARAASFQAAGQTAIARAADKLGAAERRHAPDAEIRVGQLSCQFVYLADLEAARRLP